MGAAARAALLLVVRVASTAGYTVVSENMTLEVPGPAAFANLVVTSCEAECPHECWAFGSSGDVCCPRSENWYPRVAPCGAMRCPRDDICLLAANGAAVCLPRQPCGASADCAPGFLCVPRPGGRASVCEWRGETEAPMRRPDAPSTRSPPTLAPATEAPPPTPVPPTGAPPTSAPAGAVQCWLLRCTAYEECTVTGAATACVPKAPACAEPCGPGSVCVPAAAPRCAPTPSCEYSAQHPAPWTQFARHYCCKGQGQASGGGVGCAALPAASEETQCRVLAAGPGPWRGTAAQGVACCQRYRIGCGTGPECHTTPVESMPQAQREECCRESNEACPLDCEAAGLSAADALWCCAELGAGCTGGDGSGGLPDGLPEVRQTYLLEFAASDADVGLVETNPMLLLQRVRISLVRSVGVADATAAVGSVVVGRIGALLYGKKLPGDASPWSVDVPYAWNARLRAKEVAKLARIKEAEAAAAAATPTLNTTAGVPDAAAQNGLFVEYTILGATDEDVDAAADALAREVELCLDQGRGILATTSYGYGLVFRPFGTPTEVQVAPAPDTDGSDEKTLPLPLEVLVTLSALGFVVVAVSTAYVALTKQRRAINDDNVSEETMMMPDEPMMEQPDSELDATYYDLAD